VIAHRGAAETQAEHTLSAYVQALEDGSDGLECDVRLTADQHLVCVHDRRLERTSNGKGVLSSLQLAELEQLDFGSWKNPWAELDDEADDPDPSSKSILTLERLLETVRDWGKPVDLAIEAKHPTRYAGLVERRLIDLLDRFGWARPPAGQRSPVRVMSFSWMSVRRIRELAPGLETVYLMDRVPVRFRDGTLPAGVGIAGPYIKILRKHPRYVERCHQAGNQVHVWTVNKLADLILCEHLGVDAVITDRPAKALDVLSQAPEVP
jgi:glycerophosphoryl diester phosphodiesterase